MALLSVARSLNALQALKMYRRDLMPFDRRTFITQTTFGVTALLAPPASGMWQNWRPEDMLIFVERAQTGNATSVLEMMDQAAETSWMMNMGPVKGRIVASALSELKAKRVLEIGTFLGYMSITMAQALPPGAKIVTIEKDDVNHAAAIKIMSKALGDITSESSPIESWFGASADVLESSAFLKKYRSLPFDLILMDHWKPQYADDLRRLENLGLVRRGTVLLADNVLFPGAPELLTYLGVPFEVAQDDVSGQECLISPKAVSGSTFESPNRAWVTRLISVPFEYRPLTPDAISYSVRQ